MSYAAAMREYFKKEGKPVSFPKKGSAEHSAIRALMSSGDIAPGSGVSAAVAVESGEVKVKKTKAKGAAPKPGPSENVPVKAEGEAKTSLIDVPHLNKKSEAAVEDAPEKPPVKRRGPRAVKSDGLTPQAQLLKNDTELNSGINVAPANYPGLEEQLKKVLEVKPEGIPKKKKIVEKPEISLSKTQRGNKQPDMPAVEARAPFSFAGIRALLRQ